MSTYFFELVLSANDGAFDFDEENTGDLSVISGASFIGVLGYSYGMGDDRSLAGAYAPGMAVSIVMNSGWFWQESDGWPVGRVWR